jgi:hypothetical protein
VSWYEFSAKIVGFYYRKVKHDGFGRTTQNKKQPRSKRLFFSLGVIWALGDPNSITLKLSSHLLSNTLFRLPLPVGNSLSDYCQ